MKAELVMFLVAIVLLFIVGMTSMWTDYIKYHSCLDASVKVSEIRNGQIIMPICK